MYFFKLGTFLDYARIHLEALSHNERLWSQCFGDNRKLCYNPEFLSQFCSLFPFQSMKTVRLRVNLTRPLIGKYEFCPQDGACEIPVPK